MDSIFCEYASYIYAKVNENNGENNFAKALWLLSCLFLEKPAEMQDAFRAFSAL